jgi:protein disulfide-isomerase
MRVLAATILLVFAALATAATQPYDESADAKAELRVAQAEAQRTKLPILVVFGANWCGDCRALDLAFKEGSSAPLIAKNFKVVKVNVGRNDRNMDIAASYGVPLNSGIPAVAVLSEQGKVVYVTRAGELSSASTMGDRGIYNFFAKVAAQRK